MSDTRLHLPVPTTATEAPMISAPLEAKKALAHYQPPYTLLSDMLLAVTLVPAAPLQRHFPGAPFLSVGGRIPLGMWFSRVKAFRYYDERGDEQQEGSAGTVIYNELNVVALLRRRAIFVPGIYATSSLTILIAHHHYGMPKQPVQMSMTVDEDEGRLQSMVRDGRRQTEVQARWRNAGRWLSTPLNRFWPWWSWPSLFPDGRTLQAELLETPRIYPAQVHGSLNLTAAWLPQPVLLLPVGIYTPNLCMRLPIPRYRQRLDSSASR